MRHDPAMPQLPSLDGRLFDMVSSTASTVDREAPTRFSYHERDGLIWGEYVGDTVLVGRFVGARRADTIDMRFGHVDRVSGQVVTGEASSVLTVDRGGVLELVETFDGDQQSICREATSE